MNPSSTDRMRRVSGRKHLEISSATEFVSTLINGVNYLHKKKKCMRIPSKVLEFLRCFIFGSLILLPVSFPQR